MSWSDLVPSPVVVVMIAVVYGLAFWCSRHFDEDSAEWLTGFFGGLVGLSVAALGVLGLGWLLFG